MTYMIFDHGNLVVSFDQAQEAEQALNRLAAETPEAADSLLLVAFDEVGHPVADSVPGEHLLLPARVDKPPAGLNCCRRPAGPYVGATFLQ